MTLLPVTKIVIFRYKICPKGYPVYFIISPPPAIACYLPVYATNLQQKFNFF